LVIDETIAAALGDGDGADGRNSDKPERLALEPWLYRLAMQALDELSRPDGSNGGAVHLEDSARKQNVKGSDEPELQFHQSDEAITEENVIADGRMATPEQIVGSDEIMRLIASALHDVNPAQREAFILHAVEGFGVDEISAITGTSPESVSLSISAARDHLRRSPTLVRQFKGRLAPTGTD
jgi:RNA polymerase sigma factor (sigma-70 family)